MAEYKATFNDGTTEFFDAPDKQIARAWAWEDANYQDKRVKSIKEVRKYGKNRPKCNSKIV